MNNKKFLTVQYCQDLAKLLDNKLRPEWHNVTIYPIPRGGIPVAFLLKAINPAKYVIVDNPKDAMVAVDDIIDSGATAEQYFNKYTIPTYALINKKATPDNTWYVFPWEAKENEDVEGVEDNVRRILQYIGEDVTRGGLKETPARVQKALGHWFSGYKHSEKDIEAKFKAFEDGAENYDQMIIRRNIPLYSKCEHHMADIFGTCTVAYIPKDRVLGLSKMDRIVDIYARRLQVQERLTTQIANAMWNYLDPVGVGVYINARHMCIESRGVCNQNSETITTALRGTFKDEPDCKAEFLNACKP